MKKIKSTVIATLFLKVKGEGAQRDFFEGLPILVDGGRLGFSGGGIQR